MFYAKHAHVNLGRLLIAMSHAGFPQDAEAFANQNISDPHQLQETLRLMSPPPANPGQDQITNNSAAKEDYTFATRRSQTKIGGHPSTPSRQTKLRAKSR